MLSELLHRYKTLVAAIVLSALAAGAGLPARATLNGLAVEQTRAEMPYIYVYCYDAAGTLANSTAEAYLDGKQLTFSGAEPAEEFGTSYIFLVDISGSIRADYFTAVKEQLTAFALGLGAEDDFTLITFGDEVKLLAAGSGYSAELEETINGLAGRDQHTHLYDAIASGVTYARAQDTAARQVMVIVSDGLEAKESVGTTLQEAQQQLEGADIPVYSLCVDYAGADEQERFSSFARTTGGSFYAFGVQDAEQVWQELAQEVKSCRRLTFENSDNMADGKTHTLLLKYRQGEAEESHTLSVILDRWLPDETAPLVESAEYDQQSNSLTVRFSEPVTGAENPAAYHITDGKQEYTAQSVSRQGDDYLVLLPQLKPGEYTVSYTDIFDCSMERNPLDVKELTFRRRLIVRFFVGLIVRFLIWFFVRLLIGLLVRFLIWFFVRLLIGLLVRFLIGLLVRLLVRLIIRFFVRFIVRFIVGLFVRLLIGLLVRLLVRLIIRFFVRLIVRLLVRLLVRLFIWLYGLLRIAVIRPVIIRFMFRTAIGIAGILRPFGVLGISRIAVLRFAIGLTIRIIIMIFIRLAGAAILVLLVTWTLLRSTGAALAIIVGPLVVAGAALAVTAIWIASVRLVLRTAVAMIFIVVPTARNAAVLAAMVSSGRPFIR